MNTRHAFRRLSAFAFVIALLAVSATAAFASPSNPSDPTFADESMFIIIVGG